MNGPPGDELGRLVADLNHTRGFIRYVDARQGLAGDPAGTWLGDDEFLHPDAGYLAQMIARFEAGGFAGKRRVTAAALMLRLGWAGGLQIGGWLLHDRIVARGSYALLFSPENLLVGVAIRAGEVVAGGQTSGTPDHAGMARALHDFAAPIAQALHHWSRLSERALLAMIASSWASQFMEIGRQAPGGEEAAARAARLVMAAHPELARVAPLLYRVEAAGKHGWCQRRQLCCVYFKGPERVFCDSCPILTESERLARNRALIARYGRPARLP